MQPETTSNVHKVVDAVVTHWIARSLCRDGTEAMQKRSLIEDVHGNLAQAWDAIQRRTRPHAKSQEDGAQELARVTLLPEGTAYAAQVKHL